MSRDLKALCTLLDRERDCLLRGDLNGALGMAKQKSDLAERIEHSGTGDQSSFDRMRVKAERNADLLRATSDGMGAARERVKAILMGVATQTYAADGSRFEIPVRRKGLERRA